MRNLQELPSMAAAVSKVRSWRPLRRVLTEWLAALAASRITRPELAKALRWDAAAALGFAKKGNRAALEIYLAAVAEVIALTAYIAPPPWSLQHRKKLPLRALQFYKLPLLVEDGQPVVTPRRLQHLTFREKARVHHAIPSLSKWSSRAISLSSLSSAMWRARIAARVGRNERIDSSSRRATSRLIAVSPRKTEPSAA